MQETRPVVLVVEDDPIMYELLRDLLEPAGYAVEIVQDGGTALARAADGDVDLVLLDLMLPGLDGLALCRLLRAQEGAVHLPIIMLTGLAGDAQRHAGFAAGADDYVVKPFKADELLDRVQVWVRTRQSLTAARQRAQTEEAPLSGGPDASEAPPALVHPARLLAEGSASLEEVLVRHEGYLHYLVIEAARQPGCLAAVLIPYARAQGWDESDLAEAVGCPRATLARLLLRRRPLPPPGTPTWPAQPRRVARIPRPWRPSCAGPRPRSRPGAEATSLPLPPLPHREKGG